MMRLLIIIVLSSVLFACRTDLKEVESLFQQKNENQQLVSDVELIYSDSGNVVLNLISDSMVIVREGGNPYEEFPVGVKAYFYDDNLSIISTLISDYAIRDMKENQVIARNNVYLFNDKGDTLRSDELIYNEKTGILHTTQFVRISTPNEVIYGFGFRANKDFTRYEINDISGSTQIDDFKQ